VPLAPFGPPAELGADHAALLEPTYRRLRALCPALEVGIVAPHSPVRRGWTDTAALLAQPSLLDAFLDAGAVRIRDRYGHDARPDVVATRLLHAYLWAVCLLMSGPWYLRRRVPRIRPGDIRVEIATGALDLVPGPFACLPGDPAGAVPGIRVLPHEESLAAELRHAVTDHVRPLLAVLGPRLRRGPRAVWGMVGDDLVSGIWHLGRALGREEEAVRLATGLLPGPVEPFPGGADFRRLVGTTGTAGTTGGSLVTRTRLGCCLHYTVRPAEACDTCPRVCDAERLRRAADAPG
jgi:FhuF 2Fe-2S C-terminal domain